MLCRQSGRQRPGFPEVIVLRGGLSRLKDRELPATVSAPFYSGIAEQGGEVLARLSSSLELYFLECTHELSLAVCVVIYNPPLKICGPSCCVEIRTVEEDQGYR